MRSIVVDEIGSCANIKIQTISYYVRIQVLDSHIRFHKDCQKNSKQTSLIPLHKFNLPFSLLTRHNNQPVPKGITVKGTQLI